MSKEIEACVRSSQGIKLQDNSHLAGIIQKAKSINFPKDRIQNAINRGLRLSGEANQSGMLCDLYGPHRVAMLVEICTEKKSKIICDLKAWANKRGGSMPPIGTFDSFYKKVGIINFDLGNGSDEQIIEILMSIGGEDYSIDDNNFVTVKSLPNYEIISALEKQFEQQGFDIQFAGIKHLPNSYITISDEEEIFQLKKELSALEDINGVLSVTHNAIFAID